MASPSPNEGGMLINDSRGESRKSIYHIFEAQHDFAEATKAKQASAKQMEMLGTWNGVRNEEWYRRERELKSDLYEAEKKVNMAVDNATEKWLQVLGYEMQSTITSATEALSKFTSNVRQDQRTMEAKIKDLVKANETITQQLNATNDQAKNARLANVDSAHVNKDLADLRTQLQDTAAAFRQQLVVSEAQVKAATAAFEARHKQLQGDTKAEIDRQIAHSCESLGNVINQNFSTMLVNVQEWADLIKNFEQFKKRTVDADKDNLLFCTKNSDDLKELRGRADRMNAHLLRLEGQLKETTSQVKKAHSNDAASSKRSRDDADTDALEDKIQRLAMQVARFEQPASNDGSKRRRVDGMDDFPDSGRLTELANEIKIITNMLQPFKATLFHPEFTKNLEDAFHQLNIVLTRHEKVLARMMEPLDDSTNEASVPPTKLRMVNTLMELQLSSQVNTLVEQQIQKRIQPLQEKIQQLEAILASKP
ncbi:hypothetical protein DM01DRAFT_1385334 [Hesseltinella vesiculosa]|uniref:Uncharacterized protein n=1 Tax=Hesseltinella vesiculosa TaxID=101127 RepID=A0A1X2G9W5_9FUNG|nr:hypothetical protein DM01DRAFT_1385334 [Hesseltinella vesiculosa]